MTTRQHITLELERKVDRMERQEQHEEEGNMFEVVAIRGYQGKVLGLGKVQSTWTTLDAALTEQARACADHEYGAVIRHNGQIFVGELASEDRWTAEDEWPDEVERDHHVRYLDCSTSSGDCDPYESAILSRQAEEDEL